MKAITHVSIVLGLLNIIAGCTNKKEPGSAAKEPLPVMVVNAAAFDQQDRKSYTGTVEESVGVDLTFLVSGTVISVLKEESQPVRKGELLALADESIYRSQYNMALAQQKKATDAYKRIKAVYSSGSIAEVKMVEAETGMEQAKAAAEAARQNLIHCRLYSPMGGRISKRFIEPGSTVNPGLPVMKVVKTDNVHILISVPENEVSSMTEGAKAAVTVPALNNEEYLGDITEIGMAGDPASHTYPVKIAVKNAGARLIPGMICNVAAGSQSQSHPSLVLPNHVVQIDEDGKNYVYVISNNGMAFRRTVTTGPLTDNGIIIKEGLTGKEQVVVSGYQKLSDSVRVNIR